MTGSEMDMFERIDSLPQQVRESAQFFAAAGVAALKRPERVLVCGMGGSAAAATLLAGVYEKDFELRVSRRYDPPHHWVRGSLLVFSSYSGNTEETLAAYDRLAGLGSDAVVLSSGGALGERATADGLPWIRLPGGWPPRSTLGWGVGSLVRLLGHVGLVADADQQLRAANRAMEAQRESMTRRRGSSESLLHRMADHLEGRFPLLYASDGLTEAVAARWRAQLNENSKILCGHALIPELDHNEVVGWEHETRARSEVRVVALRDDDEGADVGRRFDVTREVLGARVGGWMEHRARPAIRLARAMELVQFGDYLSVVLADRHGVDPTPVDVIDELKRRLADD